ncbi:IucA/IucC family C-terminal-domain containing protein [Laceyella putida]|uniref:IucA/IucC family C-terminal-domain containing protein n=1 Tax=Laceyella putida TaxID=110101 RepID=A0ABW2RMW2_9BACL
MITLERLEKQEQVILEQQFRIGPMSNHASSLSCSALDLLDEQQCRLLLERLAERAGGASLVAVASQFAKLYSFMVIVPALFTMSALNKGFDLSLSNIGIDLEQPEEKSLFAAQIKQWKVTKPGVDREAWRERLVIQLVQRHVTPLWHQLHRVTSVPLSILWENTAVYVYWLYETKLADLTGEEKKRAEADFQYLLQEAPASLFREKVQPLGRYYTPKCWPAHAPEPIRVRRTCCLYYQVGDTTCKTCPRNCFTITEPCRDTPLES